MSIINTIDYMLYPTKLAKSYDNFIFLSPHLDDAILSCGELLRYLSKKNKNITVITIFTKALRETISPQGRQFLKRCGYSSSIKLYKDFNLEDEKVLNFLKIKCIHLGYTDAAWRKDKGRKLIYRNPNIQFSGIVSTKDKNLTQKISKDLMKHIGRLKGKKIILGPLSIGGHVDHTIIKKIIDGIKLPKLYWEDYPYNSNKGNIKDYFAKNNQEKLLFKIYKLNYSFKKNLIRFYQSQMKSLFPQGKMRIIREAYYFPKNSTLF
jgi:hypothetical protein